MSGRGRGINNAPAWMTRGQDGPGPNAGGPPPATDRDPFGRAPPSRGLPPPSGENRGGLLPPPNQRDRDRGPPPNRGPPPPYPGDRYPPHRDRYDDRGGPRGGYPDRGGPRGPPFRGGPPPPHNQFRGGRRGGGPPPPPRRRNNGGITFRSYEEEREWVNERRRKRLARESKFDKPPTAQQLATDAAAMAMANPAATDFAGIPADRNFSAVPQQTRHARRLYIGNLPPNVTEQELHVFFRSAIQKALVEKPVDEDPILSVYINHERRFCFLEFKTVEMATACLELDGIDIHGKGKVKVKRPNDYNPTMAPKVHPSAIPILDVSRLGIISGTVQDGPNKVFIGGLHYHLTEEQVLELLQAFGKVKAFHLVKNEMDSMTSKGYCFVEYADPNVTPIAVIGLNGMDLGGGKVLTARVAGERAGVVPGAPGMPGEDGSSNPSLPRPNAIIIGGYDVEALVDAAMGLRAMPTTPMHVDQFGMPITMAVPPTVAAVPPPPPPVESRGSATLPPGPSALDIANAALSALGNGSSAIKKDPTRILVLLNMVGEEDLATDEDYQGLKEEVHEECAKFGQLLSMKIPRAATGTTEASAVKKIFLEYATSKDAANAEKELAGRQFGPNIVQASFFPEEDYLNDVLR